MAFILLCGKFKTRMQEFAASYPLEALWRLNSWSFEPDSVPVEWNQPAVPGVFSWRKQTTNKGILAGDRH